MRPASKRIIVTGASSGVGAAIARVTAHRGHSFFLTGRNGQNLADVAKATALLGAKRVSWGVGDAGSDADVTRLVSQAVTELNVDHAHATSPHGVDVLIANHGLARKGPIDRVTPDDYRDVFRTNVKGVYLWLHKIVPYMKAQRSGQIIVMGSIMGSRTAAGAALYAGSKHALEGIVGCVRKELAGSGVKVALIAPYAINTPWWTDPARGGGAAKTAAETADMLTPEDVASAVDMIINQPLGSDIERIVIEPHKPFKPREPKSAPAAGAGAGAAHKVHAEPAPGTAAIPKPVF